MAVITEGRQASTLFDELVNALNGKSDTLDFYTSFSKTAAVEIPFEEPQAPVASIEPQNTDTTSLFDRLLDTTESQNLSEDTAPETIKSVEEPSLTSGNDKTTITPPQSPAQVQNLSDKNISQRIFEALKPYLEAQNKTPETKTPQPVIAANKKTNNSSVISQNIVPQKQENSLEVVGADSLTIPEKESTIQPSAVSTKEEKITPTITVTELPKTEDSKTPAEKNTQILNKIPASKLSVLLTKLTEPAQKPNNLQPEQQTQTNFSNPFQSIQTEQNKTQPESVQQQTFETANVRNIETKSNTLESPEVRNIETMSTLPDQQAWSFTTESNPIQNEILLNTKLTNTLLGGIIKMLPALAVNNAASSMPNSQASTPGLPTPQINISPGSQGINLPKFTPEGTPRIPSVRGQFLA